MLHHKIFRQVLMENLSTLLSNRSLNMIYENESEFYEIIWFYGKGYNNTYS
jgi:hypothetical protein